MSFSQHEALSSLELAREELDGLDVSSSPSGDSTFQIHIKNDFGEKPLTLKGFTPDSTHAELMKQLVAVYGDKLTSPTLWLGFKPMHEHATFADMNIQRDASIAIRTDNSRLLGGWGEPEAVASTRHLERGNVQHPAPGRQRPENVVIAWVYNASGDAAYRQDLWARADAAAGAPLPRSDNMDLQVMAQIPLGAEIANCDQFALMTAAQLVSQAPLVGATQYVYRVFMSPSQQEGGHFGHALCVTSSEEAAPGSLVSAMNPALATIVDGWDNNSVSDVTAFLGGANPYGEACNLRIMFRYVCDGTRLPPAATAAIQGKVQADAAALRAAGPTRTQDAPFTFETDQDVHDERTPDQIRAKIDALIAEDDHRNLIAEVAEHSPDAVLLNNDQFTSLCGALSALGYAVPEAYQDRLFGLAAAMDEATLTAACGWLSGDQFLLCFGHSDANRDAIFAIDGLRLRLVGLLHNGNIRNAAQLLSNDQFRQLILDHAPVRDLAFSDSPELTAYAAGLLNDAQLLDAFANVPIAAQVSMAQQAPILQRLCDEVNDEGFWNLSALDFVRQGVLASAPLRARLFGLLPLLAPDRAEQLSGWLGDGDFIACFETSNENREAVFVNDTLRGRLLGLVHAGNLVAFANQLNDDQFRYVLDAGFAGMVLAAPALTLRAAAFYDNNNLAGQYMNTPAARPVMLQAGLAERICDGLNHDGFLAFYRDGASRPFVVGSAGLLARLVGLLDQNNYIELAGWLDNPQFIALYQACPPNIQAALDPLRGPRGL